MKNIMATITVNTTAEHAVETLTSLTLKEDKKHDRKKIVATSRENCIDLLQDKYEQEFELIMHEQESQQISEKNITSDIQNCKPLRDMPLVVGKSRNKPSYVSHTNEVGTITVTPQLTRPTTKLSYTKRCIDDYPAELNPFANEEIGKGKSTNPFGDSDDEESPDNRLVLPPQPTPRRTISSTRHLREEADNTLKLPVPLPRTISKSMPSTPNQSPLLRTNRSFRLPGSGSSQGGSNASTYNSIRRKKKLAPPPPNVSLPTLSVPFQSPTASPKTSSRPRKARMAPLPPITKPDINKMQQEISLFKPKGSN